MPQRTRTVGRPARARARARARDPRTATDRPWRTRAAAQASCRVLQEQLAERAETTEGPTVASVQVQSLEADLAQVSSEYQSAQAKLGKAAEVDAKLRVKLRSGFDQYKQLQRSAQQLQTELGELKRAAQPQNSAGHAAGAAGVAAAGDGQQPHQQAALPDKLRAQFEKLFAAARAHPPRSPFAHDRCCRGVCCHRFHLRKRAPAARASLPTPLRPCPPAPHPGTRRVHTAGRRR